MVTKSLNFGKYNNQVQSFVNKITIPEQGTITIPLDGIFPGNLKYFVQQLFWVLEKHNYEIFFYSQIHLISLNHNITDSVTTFAKKIREKAEEIFNRNGSLDLNARTLSVYTESRGDITEDQLYSFVEWFLFYIEEIYNGAPIVEYNFIMENTVLDRIDLHYKFIINVDEYFERLTLIPEWEHVREELLQTTEMRRTNEAYQTAEGKFQITSWNIRASVNTFKYNFTKEMDKAFKNTPEIFEVNQENAIFNASPESMIMETHGYGGNNNYIMVNGKLSPKTIIDLSKEAKEKHMKDSMTEFISNLKEI